MTAVDDLRSQALAAFPVYMQFYDFDDFWTRANTFTAALQFVTAVRTQWPKDANVQKTIVQPFEKVIQTNNQYFQPFLTNHDVWQDDYGWCGIACLAARDYILKFKDPSLTPLADPYLKTAETCWLNMKNNGWDAANTAQPVPHGCANRDWDRSSVGTKNTVTNACFLMLSLRLYRALRGQGDAEKYRQMAIESYNWFAQWFGPQQLYQYLRHPGDAGDLSARLIHERPWAPPDYLTNHPPKWQEGWVWTADQA